LDWRVAINGPYPLTYQIFGSNGKLRAGMQELELSSIVSKEDLPPSYDFVDDEVKKVKSSSGSSSSESSDGDSSATELSDDGPEFEPVVGEATRKYTVDKGKLPVDFESKGGRDSASSTSEVDWVQTMESLWNKMPRDAIEGRYYYAPGLPSDAATRVSMVFPRGLTSVLSMVLADNGVVGVKTLRQVDREYALRVVLDAYNTASVDVGSMVAAFTKVFSGGYVPVGGSVRRAVLEYVEEMSGVGHERRQCFKALRRLVSGLYDLEEVDKLSEIEGTRTEYHYTRLKAIVDRDRRSSSDDYAKALSQGLSVDGVKGSYEMDRKGRRTDVRELTVDLPKWLGLKDATYSLALHESGHTRLTGATFRTGKMLRAISGIESRHVTRHATVTRYSSGRTVEEY